MAESSDFVLSIPVTADMAPFRQEVQRTLGEVTSRGASIPFGGGAAGPAQQASIDRALGMVQQQRNVPPLTPAGTYRVPGGYFPQPGIATPTINNWNPAAVDQQIAAARQLSSNLESSSMAGFATVEQIAARRTARQYPLAAAERQRAVERRTPIRSPEDFDSAMGHMLAAEGGGGVPSPVGGGSGGGGGGRGRGGGMVVINGELVEAGGPLPGYRPPTFWERLRYGGVPVGADGAPVGAGGGGGRRGNRALGYARGAAALYGFSEVFGDVSALGTAEIQGARGNTALYQARAQAVRSQAMYRPLMAVDMATRGFFGNNVLGGYSPIAFEEAALGAEQGVQGVQASLGRAAMSRQFSADTEGSFAASRVAATRTGFQRGIRANYEQFKSEERQINDEITAVREQYVASDDPQERRDLQGKYALLSRTRGSRIDAATRRMGAGNEELLRAGRIAVQQARRFLPGLGAAAEGKFGLAEEEDFRAGLLNEYQNAVEGGAPGGEAAARSTALLKAEARRAAQTSSLRSRRAATEANLVQLRRGPALASQLILLKDQQRVALANAETPEAADAIREDYRARAQLAVQQTTDRRFDISAALQGEIRQSAERTRGTEESRVVAGLDRILTDNAAEVRRHLRDGEPGLAAQQRQLAEQRVKEFRADYFRSINFEEVSGDRIAASRSGNGFGRIGQAFRNAEQQAGAETGGQAGAGAGAPTAAQFNELIGIMKQFFNKNFTARAG